LERKSWTFAEEKKSLRVGIRLKKTSPIEVKRNLSTNWKREEDRPRPDCRPSRREPFQAKMLPEKPEK